MNNIYILGVPRTGKSTLSKLIKEKYSKMNIISFEAIRNGFIKTQPDLYMQNRNSEARAKILPLFICEFVYWNNIITGCSSIIEGAISDVKTISDIASKDDIIICLGFNGRSIDEVIELIKKYDRETDYTHDWSEEKLKKHFYDITDEDKKNIELCQNLNIRYFDMYENREEKLLDVIKYIEEVVKEEKGI